MKIKRITALLFTGILATSVVLGGCQKQMNPSDAVATLDGKDISIGLANYMAQFEAVTYDSYYASSLGSNMWSQDLSGKGSTLQDEVKQNILDEIRTDYLLEDHMKDYNVSVSDDENTEIKSAAAKFMSDNSAVTIKQMGATEDFVREMLRLHTIQTKMKAAIIVKADTTVSKDEAAQRTFSYYQITLPAATSTTASTEATTSTKKTSAGKAKSSKKTSTESSEQKADALKAYAQTVASDAATDFDGIAKKYNFTKSTHSYGKDESSDTFDKTVLQTADTLTDGKISGAIETKSGTYYVVRLDSSFDQTATNNKKQELVTQKQNSYYDSICKKYKAASKWKVNKDEWALVTFKGNTYTIKSESTKNSTTATQQTETSTQAGK